MRSLFFWLLGINVVTVRHNAELNERLLGQDERRWVTAVDYERLLGLSG